MKKRLRPVLKWRNEDSIRTKRRLSSARRHGHDRALFEANKAGIDFTKRRTDTGVTRTEATSESGRTRIVYGKEKDGTAARR